MTVVSSDVRTDRDSCLDGLYLQPRQFNVVNGRVEVYRH